jgi:hypothetical protein
VGGKKGRAATCTIRAVLSTDFVTQCFLRNLSGDYPWDDLAKSGYKPEVKFKNLIILPYFWLHNENHIQESDNILLFFPPSLLATENLQNRLFFECLILNFSFWRNIASKNNAHFVFN